MINAPKTNKSASTFLAIAVALSLLVALPIKAYAADKQVSISQSQSASTIQNNIQGAINSSASGDTVTVSGNVTALSGYLSLDIKAGVTVIWKANLSGSTSGLNNNIIYLTGGGTFNVSGGSVKNTGTGRAIHSAGAHATVIINSGEVSTNNGLTIYCSGETSLVSVVGGTVRSQQYHAILNDAPQGVISISGGTIEASVDWTVRVEGEDSNITVTGGSISNEFGSALSAVGPHSYVSVSGGSVCSYADRPVIEGRRVSVSGNAWVEAYGGGEALKGIGIDSEVYVSGGTVCANTGFAILTDDKGMVEISGGFVFCYGKIVGGTNSDVVLMFQGEPAIVGNSVVCAWDAPSGVPTYAEASSTALTVNSGATAKWGTSGDQVGIYYSNSGNSGFFSLYGDIIITPAGTPATPSTPSTGPGSGEEAGDPEEGDTEDGSGSDAGKQAEKPDLPSSQGDTEDSEETPESGSTGGGFNPLWILFAVLVLVAIGCGIAYMQSRKKAAAAEAQAAAAEAQAAAAASTQPLSSVDSTVELPNNTNGPSNNT